MTNFASKVIATQLFDWSHLIIIESVDSISRDGPDMPYIDILQIPKYLKIGNFVKFLSVKIRISSKLCI